MLNVFRKVMLPWLGLLLVVGAALAHGADLHGCLVEPSQLAEVGSPVVGVIERVTFERGDTVNRGKALVFLKAEVEQAATGLASARAKAEAELRSAQSNFDFAQRKLQRSVDLQQQNFISQQALDQTRTEAELAEQKLAQARENQRVLNQELALARAQLAQRTIISPIDGVVLERYVTTGQRVEQQTIAKIATLDPLRVEVIVPAAHFNKIQTGMTAIIKPDLLDVTQQQAKVTLVDRVIDTASNSFRVRLALPNPGNALPAGVRCKADFGLPIVAKSNSQAPTSRAPVAPASAASPQRGVTAPAIKTQSAAAPSARTPGAGAPAAKAADPAAAAKAADPAAAMKASVSAVAAKAAVPAIAAKPAGSASAPTTKILANAPKPAAPGTAASVLAPAAMAKPAPAVSKFAVAGPPAKLRLSTKIALSNLPQP